jgi:hypothetical protein
MLTKIPTVARFNGKKHRSQISVDRFFSFLSLQMWQLANQNERREMKKVDEKRKVGRSEMKGTKIENER